MQRKFLETLVFHFNKSVDPTGPCWALKFENQKVCVHHIEFENVSFSTKENPEHATTKGSIVFENVFLETVERDGKILAFIVQR